MGIFGKSNGGGRRASSRETLPLPAIVSTIQKNRMVVLVDLSSTGARLEGPDLPPGGESMSLRIDCVRAFGMVAWSEDGQCGVSFDCPLAGFEVERLKREASVATLTSYSLQERLAVDDWRNGVAR